MGFKKIDKGWEEIQRQFQRVCILRHEGKGRDAVELMEQTLTPLLESWTRSNSKEDSVKKRQQIESLFEQEIKRVDDAWITKNLLDDQVFQPFVHEIKSLIERQEQKLEVLKAPDDQMIPQASDFEAALEPMRVEINQLKKSVNEKLERIQAEPSEPSISQASDFEAVLEPMRTEINGLQKSMECIAHAIQELKADLQPSEANAQAEQPVEAFIKPVVQSMNALTHAMGAIPVANSQELKSFYKKVEALYNLQDTKITQLDKSIEENLSTLDHALQIQFLGAMTPVEEKVEAVRQSISEQNEAKAKEPKTSLTTLMAIFEERLQKEQSEKINQLEKSIEEKLSALDHTLQNQLEKTALPIEEKLGNLSQFINEQNQAKAKEPKPNLTTLIAILGEKLQKEQDEKINQLDKSIEEKLSALDYTLQSQLLKTASPIEKKLGTLSQFISEQNEAKAKEPKTSPAALMAIVGEKIQKEQNEKINKLEKNIEEKLSILDDTLQSQLEKTTSPIKEKLGTLKQSISEQNDAKARELENSLTTFISILGEELQNQLNTVRQGTAQSLNEQVNTLREEFSGIVQALPAPPQNDNTSEIKNTQKAVKHVGGILRQEINEVKSRIFELNQTVEKSQASPDARPSLPQRAPGQKQQNDKLSFEI